MRTNKVAVAQRQVEYLKQAPVAAQVIRRELRKTYGSVTRAARHLGMSRQALYYRMHKLGINPKEFR